MQTSLFIFIWHTIYTVIWMAATIHTAWMMCWCCKIYPMTKWRASIRQTVDKKFIHSIRDLKERRAREVRSERASERNRDDISKVSFNMLWALEIHIHTIKYYLIRCCYFTIGLHIYLSIYIDWLYPVYPFCCILKSRRWAQNCFHCCYRVCRYVTLIISLT